MASSTGEEAPGSPIVANAAPPLATMEAKMIVAIGHDHCQQLKDVLSKEDPSTMVVVLASCNPTPIPPKPRSPVMDYRLLAVACSGSWKKLQSFLNREDRQTSSDGAIGSLAMHPAFGDEEALLNDSFLDGVTMDGDTFLHVMATNSDGDNLDEDGPIRSKAVSLLFTRNKNDDTPLHCAARAEKSEMVSFLINLARGEDQDTSRVKVLLEMENNSKWTVLHEAVHTGNNDIVKLLMEEDPDLASLPQIGTSPLYLAILQENIIIAQKLYELSGRNSGSNERNLSYSGPNGQNALHAAVLRGKDLTKMLLGWNKSLTVQQDENGSTPLHLVASVVGLRDRRTKLSLLLKVNQDVLYQSDNNGLFPIHVAAAVDATVAISYFLKTSSRCAGLRDARGRTFLHIAVDKMKIRTVGSACRNRSLSWVFNMQDKDGNTALHLAIQRGSLTIFCALFGNRQVSLNLTNEKGETALDTARCNLPKGGLYYNQNSEEKIHLALTFAGAKCGISRQDYLIENDIIQETEDDHKKKEIVKDSTQNLCIGSVLIATVTFGATFAMPGGYRADDHNNGGTPTLAGRYAFDAFTLANAFAFTFSTMATISLVASGSPLYNLRSRIVHLGMAFYFMTISLTSLVAAFAIGTYMMISPVAHKVAIAVCVLSSLVLLYKNLELTMKNVVLIAPLCRRVGITWTLLTSVVMIIGNIIIQLWPIIVIFCSTAISYPPGKVEPAVQPPTPIV